MSATTKYSGVGVTWGTSHTGITSAFGTFVLKSSGLKKDSKVTELENGDGDTVSVVWSNLVKTATFEYIPAGGTATGSFAPTVPNQGDKLTVTDTIQTDIAGTNWYVMSADEKSSNTDFLMVTVECKAWPNIS